MQPTVSGKLPFKININVNTNVKMVYELYLIKMPFFL